MHTPGENPEGRQANSEYRNALSVLPMA